MNNVVIYWKWVFKLSTPWLIVSMKHLLDKVWESIWYFVNRKSSFSSNHSYRIFCHMISCSKKKTFSRLYSVIKFNCPFQWSLRCSNVRNSLLYHNIGKALDNKIDQRFLGRFEHLNVNHLGKICRIIRHMNPMNIIGEKNHLSIGEYSDWHRSTWEMTFLF